VEEGWGVAEDIPKSAIDSNMDVTTLLRKCKILAVRLGSKEFDQWVDHELNGYGGSEELPEYRISNYRLVREQFAGPFGSG